MPILRGKILQKMVGNLEILVFLCFRQPQACDVCLYFSIAFNTAYINVYLVLMLHCGPEGHKCVLVLWSLTAFHLTILSTTL